MNIASFAPIYSSQISRKSSQPFFMSVQINFQISLLHSASLISNFIDILRQKCILFLPLSTGLIHYLLYLMFREGIFINSLEIQLSITNLLIYYILCDIILGKRIHFLLILSYNQDPDFDDLKNCKNDQ